MNAYVVPNNPKDSDSDIDLDSDNTEDTILRTTNILLGSRRIKTRHHNGNG